MRRLRKKIRHGGSGHHEGGRHGTEGSVCEAKKKTTKRKRNQEGHGWHVTCAPKTAGRVKDMIYRRCPGCGRRIEVGKRCETCYTKRRNSSNRIDGIRHEYKTARWQRIRSLCLQTFDHIDLYALYHDGRLLSADRVHHIYEVLDYPEKFYDPDNHIPVSDWSHQEIHRRYRDEDPEKVRQELIRYRQKWMDSVR